MSFQKSFSNWPSEMSCVVRGFRSSRRVCHHLHIKAVRVRGKRKGESDFNGDTAVELNEHFSSKVVIVFPVKSSAEYNQ